MYKLPIYNHREIVGYAGSKASAEKIIRKTIFVDKRARLHVWERNTDIIDLPAGFVFGVSWGTK